MLELNQRLEAQTECLSLSTLPGSCNSLPWPGLGTWEQCMSKPSERCCLPRKYTHLCKSGAEPWDRQTAAAVGMQAGSAVAGALAGKSAVGGLAGRTAAVQVLAGSMPVPF